MNNLTTSIEVITPAKAEDYLRKNVFNRKLNQNIVNLYANEMKEGRWNLNGDAIRFDTNGCLLDGQHRLYACIKAMKPFSSLVIRGLDNRCFATIDNGKVRSASDILSINGIPQSANISSIVRKFIRLNNELVTLSKSGGGPGANKISNILVLETYLENKQLFTEANRLSKKCYESCKAFNASDVGGIYCYLVATKKHNEHVVQDFFEQLTDVKRTGYNVISSCRKKFVNDKVSLTHMQSSVRQTLLIKAWNYFIRGKDVRSFGYNKDFDKDIWFI